MPTAVEIYTRPGCGYCTATKSLLTRKNAAFTELSVATDPAYREQMYDRAGDGTTFPQIFIGTTHVGGCDELYALDRVGKPDAMLAGGKASLLALTRPLPRPWCRCAPGYCPSPASSQAAN